jgi:O-antigen/teichoic acid export membrane protein
MSRSLNDSLRTLFKSGVFLLVGFVLQLGLSFLGKVLIARALSQSDFGTIALGFTLSTFAVTGITLGLPQAVTRYLPRYDTVEDKRGVLVTAFVVVVPAAVGMSLAVVLAAPYLATAVFETPDAVPVFRVFGLCVFLMAMKRLTIGTVRGMKQSAPKVLIENIATPLTRLVAVGVVITVGGTVIDFAWAYFVGWLVAAVLGSVYVFRWTPLFDFSVAARRRYRELASFSLPLLVTAVLALIFGNIDKLMLGFFRTPSEVGVYDVAYSLGKLLTTGLMAFNFVFLPIISEYHSDGRLTELRQLYLVVTKWVAVVTLPVFLLMLLFPNQLVGLTFGPKYSSGSLALRVLALGFFLHASAGLNRETLISIGHTRFLLYTSLFAAALNVTLNLLLIPTIGPLGAAIATTVTFLALNAIVSGYLFRSERVRPLDASVAKPLVVTLLAASLLYLGLGPLTTAPLSKLVVFVIVFAPVYTVVLFRFGAVQSEEVMILNSVEERFGIDLDLIKRTGIALLSEEDRERPNEGNE